MAQVTSNKALRGLDLNSNPLVGNPSIDFGGAAKSAAQIAENCVLSRQRMISNRRGFDYFTQGTSALVDSMFEYQSQVIEHQADNTMWYGSATSGSRTQYTGTFVPPSPYRTDFAVGRGNLYFTSTMGVQKVDQYTHTPMQSGITKGLDVRVTTTGTGNGFMSPFSKAAYHVTWVRTDANNQLIQSDVSTRPIVTNATQQSVGITSAAGTATATTPLAHGFSTGDQILIAGADQPQYNGTFAIVSTGSTTFTYAVSGSPASPATSATNILTAGKAMNVLVSFTVPWDVQSGDFYQIWRTVTNPASTADPGDTCYLVSKTLNVTAAGGTITFTDTTPDSILSGSLPLYTNATQQGALQGNSRPPMCSSICTYKDYTLYANSAVDHQLVLNCLAVINFIAGTSQLLLTNGTVTRTYTMNTVENVATQTIQLFTGGSSNASNIEQTIRSTCHVINGDSSGLWYAEYTSGPNDNPGIFRIWARNPLSGAFWVLAGDATAGAQFSPVLPTSGASVISSNDYRGNRLFYSKFQAPDAVPILNTIDVGRLDQPILRVLAVRDACYIIKADGIFYLSGLVAPFSLIELDTTCHCIAPATAVALNNQVYLYSNQGVVKISTSGVTVVSFDIEPVMQGALLTYPNLAAVAFGVAHESDRHYLLWLPTTTGDTYGTQCYVFHTFIQEWTSYTKPAASGVVLNSNFSLYISSGLENAVLKQRRSNDFTDYSDETQNITIISQTGFVVTLTWTATLFPPTAGVSLHQAGAFAKVVTATLVTGTTWQLTIDRTSVYTAGAATARMPIYAHLQLAPNALGGEAGVSKSIYSVTFLLATDTVSQAVIEVATNEATLFQQFPITRAISGGWGSFSWGNIGWGGSPNTARSVPWQVALPIPDTTGEFITAGWIHNVSQEQFSIAQVAYDYDQLVDYSVTQ